MLLPLTLGLQRTWRCDPEMAMLADRHYSRQHVGARDFMGNGKTLVLRDQAGLVVFGWLWQVKRDDQQEGYNCTIFRNESDRRSSDIILEAESAVVGLWGPGRAFTYIDPTKVRSANPGYCFKVAGWNSCGKSKSGKLILYKYLHTQGVNNGRQ